MSCLDYWNDTEVIKTYVKYLEEILHISNENLEEDWYRVAQAQLSHLGGAQLVKMNGGLAEVNSQRVFFFRS
jgi:hypothetical protein